MTLNLAQSWNDRYSTPRSQDITIVFPQKSDGVFLCPEDVSIRVSTAREKYLSCQWALSHNYVKEPIITGLGRAMPDGSFLIEPDVVELRPGFYDLTVTLRGDEVSRERDVKKVSTMTTFGWKPDEMAIVDTTPEGFESFWKSSAEEVRNTPLNMKLDLIQVLRGREIDTYNRTHAGLPGNYDPDNSPYDAVEIYKVSFDAPDGGRLHAWFAKPEGEGPFPGLLVLPGAGNNPRPAPVEHARHGWAALDLQVHGFPVDYPVYPQIRDSAGSDPEEHSYYRIYRNALMAVGALINLPSIDSEYLAACGGSQGGRLTTVVCALDPRLDAGVAAITHFANISWLNWAKQQNKRNENGADGYGVEARMVPHIDDWYDVANFAPMIEQPMLFNAGIIDRVSPATGIQAVYLRTAGPKEIVYLPNMAHDWSPVFDRYAWKWLNRNVGVNPSALHQYDMGL